MQPHSARRRRVALLALLAAVASAACSGQDPNVTAGDEREVAVYTEVLGWLIENAEVTDGGPDPLVVFVASRSATPIDVDVQVALVDTFAETISLRFVDERAEALIEDETDRPVRNAGMLVGLGAVDAQGEVVEVYADRYFSATRAEAWIVTMERSGESWQMRGRPVASDLRPVADDS